MSEKEVQNNKEIYVSYTVTRDAVSKEILDFEIMDCYETETLAKKHLQYEVDLAQKEGRDSDWINDHVIKLSSSADEEKFMTFAPSDFYPEE